ncbi:MAG: methyl-accepting chemotaxis protein [Treponema sp.]|nr:methyl-accepting chemotaxis protein [Treponema sp.]
MKKSQSLKIRFIVFFAGFLAALFIVTSFGAVQNISKIALDIFASQGRFVVEKAAALIDGDSFEALVASMDSDDPFYEETRQKLYTLKQSSNCVYLYTMAPAEGNEWYFVIDGSSPPDDQENFSALGDTDDVSSYDSAFLLSWETGTVRSGKPEFQSAWGWLISSYAPIRNSAGTLVGIAGIDFPAEELVKTIRFMVLRQILTGVVSLAVGFLIFFVFQRMIFGKLSAINIILKEISEGEGDLTRHIEIKRMDEVGELGSYFNLTLDKIKNMVTAIKTQAGSLHNVGQELSVNMEETASEVRKINTTIQSIMKKTINQSASVTQTGVTMEQVTRNIGRLNDQVTEQTGSVSRSSSAIEEMLANIKSVTRTLEQNAENVRQLTASSELGQESLQGVSRDVQEIARESEGLLQINTVMQNIASQTNLLAMNAAIEAAHAGEAGKGFAVVADEIRKLAENSGKQSRTISSILKKIKESIDLITDSVNTVLFQIQTIGEKVRIVSDQESSILNAMEEQSHGSQEILESVAKLNEITQSVEQGSSEMLVGSQEVIQESKNLERLSKEITGGMNEIIVGMDQINTAINRVNELSADNRNHIDNLAGEVSRFKVE